MYGSCCSGVSALSSPPFELFDIWPDHQVEWSFTPPEPLNMRRSDEAFHKKLRANLDRFTGTYKAVFEKQEISLGDEPFKFLGLCCFDELISVGSVVCPASSSHSSAVPP